MQRNQKLKYTFDFTLLKNKPRNYRYYAAQVNVVGCALFYYQEDLQMKGSQRQAGDRQTKKKGSCPVLS
jgi:hypothetical protein